MHDEAHHEPVNGDPALAAALRALPSAPPPPDGWQRLAGQVVRRRRMRATLRVAVPAAVAAAVAIAIGMPHLRPMHATSSAPRVAQRTGVPAQTPGADLDVLRAQSQRLQAWVRALDRDGTPLNGDALADAVALQDRIGLVDLQLSAATDPASRASLWQERNLLLQQLGLLHLQPYSVAEHARATPDEATIL